MGNADTTAVEGTVTTGEAATTGEMDITVAGTMNVNMKDEVTVVKIFVAAMTTGTTTTDSTAATAGADTTAGEENLTVMADFIAGIDFTAGVRVTKVVAVVSGAASAKFICI
ncbi:MAG: hypothetical protein NVS9B13_18660 [Candidatus Acidiferrum sp.]